MSNTVRNVGGAARTMGASSETQPQSREANEAAWKNLTEQALSNYGAFISSSGEGKIRTKLEAEMKSFLDAHPNASAKDLEDHFNKQFNSQLGAEMVVKFTLERFQQRTMQRIKEMNSDGFEW